MNGWKQQALFLTMVLAIVLPVLSRVQAQEDITAPTPEAEKSWLILPEMPETATQADYGAEIYRLICQDCHGGVGQGLTDAWRAEAFAPEDQNCWQSKCHNSTHPVDGFVLPEYVPPLAGETALSRFNTSLDLYDYMRAAMPYHNPGSLLDSEYMQLAAFIVRLNGLDKLAGGSQQPALLLDARRASQIVLHPDRPTPEPTAVALPAPLPQQTPTLMERWLWGFLIVLGVIGAGTAVLYWRRS